jgi:hypothetical protein
VTEPPNAWAPPEASRTASDSGLDEPSHASTWAAVVALPLCGLCVLRVVLSFSDLHALENFGETDATEKLRYLAQFATSSTLPLAIALGVVALEFVVSPRDFLTAMERTALLVVAGVGAALTMLATAALVRDLAATPSDPRPFLYTDRVGSAIAVVSLAAIAVAAFALAQRFATDWDEPDDDLDDDFEDLEDDDEGSERREP